MLHILFYILPLMFCCRCSGTEGICPEDRAVLGKFWQYAEKERLVTLPVGERIPLIGRFFLDTPYVGKTLDNPDKEELVVNLRGLDCVTFVENVLALAFLPRYGEGSTDNFTDNLQTIRYRDGIIEDYSSRLHYSSDWFYEMQKKGMLTDESRQEGSKAFHPEVSFMSGHPSSYPAMLQHPEQTAKIREVEKRCNAREFFFVPKDKVEAISDKIKAGDIILITTNIKGLDTSHLGIAVKVDGQVHLMHASSSGRKIMVSPQPLYEYMQGIRSQTGIMIGRATDRIP